MVVCAIKVANIIKKVSLSLSCHMFGTKLLTQLITCDFIVCYDMFVHLSLFFDVWN